MSARASWTAGTERSGVTALRSKASERSRASVRPAAKAAIALRSIAAVHNLAAFCVSHRRHWGKPASKKR